MQGEIQGAAGSEEQGVPLSVPCPTSPNNWARPRAASFLSICLIQPLRDSRIFSFATKIGNLDFYRNSLDLKMLTTGTSLVLQWLRLRVSNAGEVDSTPGQGSKVPHAAWVTKNLKKKLTTNSNFWKKHCPGRDHTSHRKHISGLWFKRGRLRYLPGGPVVKILSFQ